MTFGINWIKGNTHEKSASQQLTLDALNMALTNATPLIFHSDQGSQAEYSLHTDMLDEAHVRISMSDKGKPTQNGIPERFMRTLKEEHVDFADYADFPDTMRQIAYWLEVESNTQPIHSALDYATPAEVEAAPYARLFPST